MFLGLYIFRKKKLASSQSTEISDPTLLKRPCMKFLPEHSMGLSVTPAQDVQRTIGRQLSSDSKPGSALGRWANEISWSSPPRRSHFWDIIFSALSFAWPKTLLKHDRLKNVKLHLFCVKCSRLQKKRRLVFKCSDVAHFVQLLKLNYTFLGVDRVQGAKNTYYGELLPVLLTVMAELERCLSDLKVWSCMPVVEGVLEGLLRRFS